MRILQKKNRLQMSQVFSVSARLSFARIDRKRLACIDPKSFAVAMPWIEPALICVMLAR
jgi:hypothetical protein